MAAVGAESSDGDVAECRRELPRMPRGTVSDRTNRHRDRRSARGDDRRRASRLCSRSHRGRCSRASRDFAAGDRAWRPIGERRGRRVKRHVTVALCASCRAVAEATAPVRTVADARGPRGDLAECRGTSRAAIAPWRALAARGHGSAPGLAAVFTIALWPKPAGRSKTSTQGIRPPPTNFDKKYARFGTRSRVTTPRKKTPPLPLARQRLAQKLPRYGLSSPRPFRSSRVSEHRGQYPSCACRKRRFTMEGMPC